VAYPLHINFIFEERRNVMPQHKNEDFLLDYFNHKEAPQRNPEDKAKSDNVSEWLALILPPTAGQVDNAFNKGTKLICDLLAEGKIDSETATEVLAHFFELYVEHKVEFAIDKFLSKRVNKPLLNTLRFYLENK